MWHKRSLAISTGIPLVRVPVRNIRDNRLSFDFKDNLIKGLFRVVHMVKGSNNKC